MALSKSQKSLNKWTRQKWGTKSGKPSTQGTKASGERYLPAAALNLKRLLKRLKDIGKFK